METFQRNVHIYNCVNGHFTCGDCKLRMDREVNIVIITTTLPMSSITLMEHDIIYIAGVSEMQWTIHRKST